MAVITTVETREYVENGKRKIATITHYEGLAIYTDELMNDGKPFQAEMATFEDYGKQGVTRSYTKPRAPATEEEKARNREKIYEAAAVALHRRGIW